jgi:hypothetical protein
MLDIQQHKSYYEHAVMCIVKVSKCKQSSILTSIHNTNSLNIEIPFAKKKKKKKKKDSVFLY